MKFLSILLFSFCTLFFNLDVKSSESKEKVEKSNMTCDDYSNLIIISTMDGILTALDMDSGTKCWSVALDHEKFLASTLSNIEIYENGQRVWLVPSLDGGLFKYNNLKLQPLPIDVDSLISYFTYLDAFTSISGGKIRVVYGIHRLTGEVIYTCKSDGCYKSKSPFPKDILIVEELISLVNAVDSNKGEIKWNFRVVELKIKIPSQESVDSSNAFQNYNDKNALIPSNFKEFINFDAFKISLQHGFAGMFDKSTQKFLWLFKTSCPINDAWYVKNNVIKVLDPFDKESGFFSVEMDDGQHTALLFLGSYENQLYIKKSRKFSLKAHTTNSLSTHLLYQTYLRPVCPKPDDDYFAYNNSDSNKLLPSNLNIYVSDCGSYYYINFSVGENVSHCIVNSSYIVRYDNGINSWFAIYAMTVAILLSTMFVPIFQLIREKNKQYVNASTSVGLSTPVNVLNVPLDFKSRFDQDFELLAVLGQGGFGVVLDVKNKIDDCRYAVKRIPINEKLNDSQYEKVLREVKALAKLDHHGIVRYFNAWIEYPPAGWQQSRDLELNFMYISESSLSPSVSTKSGKETPITSRLRKKLRHNPLQFDDSLNSIAAKYDTCKFSKSSESSESISSLSDKLQKDSMFYEGVKLDNDSDDDCSICFEESSTFTENVLFGNKAKESSMCPSSDLYNVNTNIFLSELYGRSKESQTNNVLLDELRKFNEIVVYSLDEKNFRTISRFLFHVAEPDFNITEYSDWILFLDFLPHKSLIKLQKWLICMLCFICSSEQMEFEFVINNLCFILWDLDRKLEAMKILPLNKMQSISDTKSSETVICVPSHDSSKNLCESSDDKCKLEGKSISLKDKKAPRSTAYGFLYIQMQLCKKESLRDWLDRHCIEREYNTVFKIFKEIVDAVDYVHNCGLMHRDLKPSNIYFSMEGAIKIGDFGLATSSDIHGESRDGNERFSFNRTQDIGTEFYMSPEQKLQQDYDCKTDIYSLGIILFELLVPFVTQFERLQALVKVRKLQFPNTFLQTYRDESELVKKMLNYNPKNRPSTNEIKEHLLLMKSS